MRFRLHRGSLADSMETCRTVETRAAFYAALPVEADETTIEVKLYVDGPDTRIGWERTFIVKVAGYGVVGFTDGPLESLA